jgi:cold shock CspA family protein
VADLILLAVTASDPDIPANTLNYAATGLPPGLSIDPETGLISGTVGPDENPPASHYEVEITVTDDGTPEASAVATFTWAVNEVAPPPDNEPPLISPIDDQFSDEGDVVTLLASATDTDPLVYAAIGLPPGLDLDPATGFITGTVGGDAIGSHAVTITVTDRGTPVMATTTTFDWTVTDVVAAETKDDSGIALESFESAPAASAQESAGVQPIRRSLVLMSSAAAASTEALRWPLGLLFALLVGFATVGRVGLYPLLWRGDRHRGTVTFFDPELNFGLIAPDEGGEAVFVHAHAFPRRQRPSLEVGAAVRYRVLASDNRSSAWGATMEPEDD